MELLLNWKIEFYKNLIIPRIFHQGFSIAKFSDQQVFESNHPSISRVTWLHNFLHILDFECDYFSIRSFNRFSWNILRCDQISVCPAKIIALLQENLAFFEFPKRVWSQWIIGRSFSVCSDFFQPEFYNSGQTELWILSRFLCLQHFLVMKDLSNWAKISPSHQKTRISTATSLG